MDTTTTQCATTESRLHRLERTNARWRAGALAGLAGVLGLLIGGMGQPQQRAAAKPDESASGYQYVSVGDTIYRIDKFGDMSYITVGGVGTGGVRSSNGYFNWGRVRIDRERSLSDRPQ
jgi:hypothetical protein